MEEELDAKKAFDLKAKSVESTFYPWYFYFMVAQKLARTCRIITVILSINGIRLDREKSQI